MNIERGNFASLDRTSMTIELVMNIKNHDTYVYHKSQFMNYYPFILNRYFPTGWSCVAHLLQYQETKKLQSEQK